MMPNQGLVVRATTCCRSRNAANACYSLLILCVGWGTTALVVRANAATRRWLRAYAERYGRLPEEARLTWPHPYVEDLIGNVRPPGPQAELFS